MKQIKASLVSSLAADSGAAGWAWLVGCMQLGHTITPTPLMRTITHTHQLNLCALDLLDSQHRESQSRRPATILAVNIVETIAEGALGTGQPSSHVRCMNDMARLDFESDVGSDWASRGGGGVIHAGIVP